MKQLSSLFLYSSFFIALIAAAMCWQTYQLLELPVSPRIIILLFAGTLAGYNLHFYFQCKQLPRDEYGGWLLYHRTLLLVLSLIGFATVAFIAYPLKEIWKPLGVAIALHAAYSLPLLISKKFFSLKYLGFFKPFILSAGWAFATVFIAHPVYNSDTIILSGMRFLLVLPIALLFDYRDRHIDKENNIYTLSNFFGDNFTRVSVVVAVGLMLTAGFLTGKIYGDALFYGTGAEALFMMLWDPMGPEDKSSKYYLSRIDGLLLFSPLASIIFEFIKLK